MKLFLSLLFLIPSIIVGIFDGKKRKLEGIKKITTFLFYLYFGISWCIIFYVSNIWIAMFIWMHWLFLGGVFNIKETIYSSYMLMVIGISGMVLSLIYIFNLDFKLLWMLWTVFGVSIYLLPICSYFDRKRKFIEKVKRCTEEVDAKIIKVYRGSEGKNRCHPIYIPKFEFKLNDKIYKFMDSTEIYFKNKELCEVGMTVKLFVSSNPKIDSPNGCKDVFLPNSQKEDSYRKDIIFFYVSTLVVFLMIIILRLYG